MRRVCYDTTTEQKTHRWAWLSYSCATKHPHSSMHELPNMHTSHCKMFVASCACSRFLSTQYRSGGTFVPGDAAMLRPAASLLCAASLHNVVLSH